MENEVEVEPPLPALGVHVDGEVLEDVHVAAVGDGGHGGAVPLGSDELDRLKMGKMMIMMMIIIMFLMITNLENLLARARQSRGRLSLLKTTSFGGLEDRGSSPPRLRWLVVALLRLTQFSYSLTTSSSSLNLRTRMLLESR